jgi:hypothetical protein
MKEGDVMKMKPILFGLVLLASSFVLPAAPAHTQGLPDLVIRQAQAVPNDDRKLRVNVVNTGRATAGNCNLKLFYHRSGHIMVRNASVSEIQAGGSQWVLVDIGSPIAHASKVTLRVDDPDKVSESNEGNNWNVYK